MQVLRCAQDDKVQVLRWQWGDNSGFKYIFLADPQNEKGDRRFTNGDRGARVYERVIRALNGEDHPAFLWT